MQLKTLVMTALVGSVVLAGCAAQSGPVRQFTKGDELAYYNFSEPDTFEEGLYSTIYGGVALQIADGKYQIRLTQGDGEIWWGQWGEAYGNVVIDADVEQLSERNENAYGMMCRVRGSVISPQERAEIDPEVQFLATQVALSELAQSSSEVTPEVTPEATGEPSAEMTPEATEPAIAQASIPAYGEGDGYLFLITGTGSYSIQRSRGRDIRPLVDWTPSDAINIGPDKNHLRAVCIDDYLAFYINETFVADVIDDTYTSGQIGLAASASNRLGVTVEFDNVQVSEARPG